MICCRCGEVLDFQYKPIGKIFMIRGITQFICKDCKKLEKEENKKWN